MTTMLTEAYDALREIGVSEEKARKVAEALATHEPAFAAIRSDLRILQWQVGALLALLAALAGPTLWLVVRIAARVPGALPGA